MKHNWAKIGIMIAALGASSSAQAESYGIMLSYFVPIQCTITHGVGGSTAAATADGAAIALGALHEYCNAAKGYNLVVHYTPGSLHGMVLIAGDARVTLDGSGQAVVARSPIPQIRDRPLAAIPGPQGFDTDHLDFEAIADPA